MINSKYEPQARYHKKIGLIQFKMTLSPKTETDIIEMLEAQSNKAGYIKRLIRDDIERNKKIK